MAKETCEVEIFDCMEFNEIYNLALVCIKQYGHKELNDKSQPYFDEFFNKIFSESWGLKTKSSKKTADKKPLINYATWKVKMKEAEIFANKKGLRKGNADYKEAFLQHFYATILNSYDDSLTPSGSIKGKNKPDTLIVVPNPTRKQKSGISPDIFDLFPSIMDTAKAFAKNKNDENEKINHIKSGLTSTVKYLGENVFDIKALDYPAEATNDELVKVEIERYKQLIVFTMLMVGIENVVSVSTNQMAKLLERFLPVDENESYSWAMLHNTKNRQTFVNNIYDVLRKNKSANADKPKQKLLG